MDLVITSRAALEASPWRAYLDRVYGVDTISFPFNLTSLFYFYERLLPPRSVVPRKLAKGPLREGDFYHLDKSPGGSLFRYIYPRMAGLT